MPFSASDAALEGFSVLKAHWRLVIGWAGFNLIGMVALIIVAALAVGGLAATDAIAEDALGGALSVILLGGDMIIQTMVAAALYRMLLRSDPPGFLHLQLRSDEMRLLAIWVIVALGLAVLGGAGFFVVRAAAKVSGAAAFGAGIAALGAAIWLGLRFGLVGPLSIAQGRIDFAGSWRLTQGRFWPLLGMWVLNLIVVLMVWLAWWVAAFILVGLLTGFGGAGEGAEGFASHPLRYLLEGASPLLFAPVILVLQQTPFVAAYQAFTGAEDARPPAAPI